MMNIMIYGNLKSFFYCIPVDANYPSNKIVTPSEKCKYFRQYLDVQLKNPTTNTFSKYYFLKSILLSPKAFAICLSAFVFNLYLYFSEGVTTLFNGSNMVFECLKTPAYPDEGNTVVTSEPV